MKKILVYIAIGAGTVFYLAVTILTVIYGGEIIGYARKAAHKIKGTISEALTSI